MKDTPGARSLRSKLWVAIWSLDQIATVEQFLDLSLEQGFDLHPVLERAGLRLFLEQGVVAVEVLQVHPGVEVVFRVEVHGQDLGTRPVVLGQ